MPHHLVGAAEVAEMLGVSRQRVAQLVEQYEDFPKPEVELASGRVWSRTAIETWIAAHPERGKDAGERRPMFERFTDGARGAIVNAQEEARLLVHNYLGTEHLLLGILREPTEPTGRTFADAGLTVEIVRSEIRGMIGLGKEPPTGHIPFTPRAKTVLELAVRESIRLGQPRVSTAHIALALAKEGEGVAAQIMTGAGLSEPDVRTMVLESVVQTVRWVGELPIVDPEGYPPQARARLACSFCGKSQQDAKKLIAGPGVYICDDCVRLCEQIIAEEIG